MASKSKGYSQIEQWAFSSPSNLKRRVEASHGVMRDDVFATLVLGELIPSIEARAFRYVCHPTRCGAVGGDVFINDHIHSRSLTWAQSICITVTQVINRESPQLQTNKLRTKEPPRRASIGSSKIGAPSQTSAQASQ